MIEKYYKNYLGRVCVLERLSPGQRPTIFLHGWMDNAASFLPLSKHLSNESIALVDMPGHGKSDHYHRPYTFEDYVYTLYKLAEDISNESGFDKVNIVGHSLGGVVLSLFASAYPGMIHRKIFIDSYGPLSSPPEDAVNRIQIALRSRLKIERRVIQTKDIEKIELNFNREKGLNTPKDSQNIGELKDRNYYRSIQDCAAARTKTGDILLDSCILLGERGISKGERGFFWNHDSYLKVPSMRRYTEPEVVNILSSFEGPTHLIQAANPIEVARKVIEKRKSCMPNLTCEILAGGHHLHMEESSEACAELIKTWINS